MQLSPQLPSESSRLFHFKFLAQELYCVAGGELVSATGFDCVVDEDFAPLNEQLRLAAGRDQAGHLHEVVQSDLQRLVGHAKILYTSVMQFQVTTRHR